MKQGKKKHTGITVIVMILVLVLSLGLLARLMGGFGKEVALIYDGTKIAKNVEKLEVVQGSEIEIKLKNKDAGYDVKIYGEEFSEVLIQRTEKGFKVVGGVREALQDKYGSGVELPKELPSGDLFRMEITSGKTTLKIGFSVKENEYIGVEKVELQPGELIF